MDFDPATVAGTSSDSATRALGQFEPDNDGTCEGHPAGALAVEGAEEMPWIPWADAALELAWAGSALAAEWRAVTRLAARR